MKKILFITIASLMALAPANAQRKWIDKGFKLMDDAHIVESKNNTPQLAKKAHSKLICKYKDAGMAFLKADTNITQKQRLVAQSYALICLNKYQDMLMADKKYKDIVSTAQDVTPRLWMTLEKIPAEVHWDSVMPHINVTAQDFINYREEYFETALEAARFQKDWKAIQHLGAYYLTIVPEPEQKSDVTNFYKRLNGYYALAFASGMSKSAPASRENAFNFYEYVLKKRNMLDDKRKVLVRCVSMDSLFHSNYFNYTDFDDNIKVRPVAARAFEKLDDLARAYRLFDESVNSGSKSIALMMGRLNIAAEMQDFDKVGASLKPFEEKKYAGELTHDQEKKIREYKAMLKKEM